MSSVSNVTNTVDNTSFISFKNKNFVILLVLLSVTLVGAGFYYFVRPKIMELYSEPQTNDTDKIVLYYTEWCGHSQTFIPIFTEFTEFCKTHEKLKNIIVEKIDCVAEATKCTANNITGYPTILLLKDGKNIEFNGKRTVDGLTSWALENLNL